MANRSHDPKRSRLRICLAASGGGHVRQLLDLEPVWSRYDHFFITEPTALGVSLGQDHRHYFVPHFAIGQIRLGSAMKMMWASARNLVVSAQIIMRERPDVVLTTGAGAVWFTLFWARLLGSRCIVMETFARFDTPSLFARWSSPLAHQMILQSPGLQKYWPDAPVFDPLRELDGPRPPKDRLLFATVGATLPFPRLVASIVALKHRGDISHEVLIQSGETQEPVEDVKFQASLSYTEIQDVLRRADIVVCHGGTGSLISALREGCHVIAMPRLPQLCEHYDDHQAEISKALAARNLVTVARSTEELAQALLDIGHKVPKMATTDHSALMTYLNTILDEMAGTVQGVNRSSSVAQGANKPDMRVCLAGSGGGHVRQLLDLQPFWSKHSYFFVSEDTALSRSIAKTHPMRFVPHFALGQARIGSPWVMLRGGVANFFVSAKIMLAERPTVVVTTGAGAVFFTLLWARLLGAKIIAVESFARFSNPSVFGRLSAPFAHHKVVQSQALADIWPEAKVFDPLRMLDTARPPKQALVFGTVGATLPFDRMIDMIEFAAAQGAIPETIRLQVGNGGRILAGAQTSETLPFEEMQATLRDADIVICHGGTGSLVTALRQGCRVIAVPRLHALDEAYDDHQAEITEALEARGMITVANTPEELVLALTAARNRDPVMVTSDPSQLIAYLDELIVQPAT